MFRVVRALLVSVVGLAAVSGCGRAEPEPRVRIVLITLDTLRWSGWIGVNRALPMPRTVARLAAGAVFDQAFAATSSTQPTHASLFTGLHPWEHGVTRNGLVLGDEHATLAERLAAAGYETRAVVASFPLSAGFGFEQGFGAYDDAFERKLGDESTWNREDVPDNAFYSLGGDVTRRALAQLDAADGPRQFFWFHYFDPHDPYGDAAGERSLEVGTLRQAAIDRDTRLDAVLVKARALYLADLGALDAGLDVLLERLAQDAAEFETHVVITSDHGESFGEDGSVGHGTRVTRSQVHVPLGILSARVAPGARADACGSVDVHATLLDLAGLAPPAGAARSLVGPAPADGGAAYGMRRTFDETLHEVRTDGSVVALDGLRFFAFEGGTLYGGRAGAIELEDDGSALPSGERADALSQRFAGYEAALELTRAAERGDDASLEALRALGYTR